LETKSFTIFFGIILVFSLIQNAYAESEIPGWVKNNAGWWAEGLIGDSDFVSGIQFLIEKGIIVIPETTQSSSSVEVIPDWIQNVANFWAKSQITDTEFLNAIQYLIKVNVIKIDSDMESKEESNMKNAKNLSESKFRTVGKDLLFDVYGIEGEDYILIDEKRFWWSMTIQLKPELSDLYDDVGITMDPQNTVVVFPIFTSSAYEEPGFYTYYRGVCDSSCLTTNIEIANRWEASGNAIQVLNLLRYPGITDVDIDKNPNILNEFDKVILLHNEYVTRKEFNAITNHPNVIYLYPNALYAEVTVNYADNTITLVRGHNYPEPEIKNGFDWQFDNTHPFEFDSACEDWKFYEIDNGVMLNCYPEIFILESEELLKAIKDF